jgi:hypothetical protein
MLLCDAQKHARDPRRSHPQDEVADYMVIRYAHTLIHRIVV